MSSIFFSIIIPVYNAKKYLHEAIDSVLMQNYPNIEIILVDDGSTDGSSDICDYYGNKYDFIHVLHKKNEGQLSARNAGVNLSTGEYLLFLDSDDAFLPKSFDIINNYLVEEKYECLIFGYHYESSLSKGSDEHESNLLLVSDKKELYKKILINGNYNSMCRKVIKRDLCLGFDFSKYHHVRHGEDLIQTMEIIRRCERVLFIPEVLYYYRKNDSSVSNSVEYSNIETDFLAREYTLKIINEENVFSKQDYNMYATFCKKIFFSKISEVCKLNISKFNRINLLKSMRSGDWYNKFIRKYGKNYVNLSFYIVDVLFDLKLFYIVLFLFRKKYK